VIEEMAQKGVIQKRTPEVENKSDKKALK
jgi:hypothetical protein